MLGIPQVFGDHIAHARDFGQFVAHIGNGEVKVLRPNQEDIVAVPLPHRLQQPRHQLQQATGLLEVLVFLKQGNHVLEARVEGVSHRHFVGNGLGPPAGGFRLGGLG